MKVAFILLNYRTSQQIIDMTDKIKGLIMPCEPYIIIIDNNSGDGSYETFQNKFANDKTVDVIFSDKNTGYAVGNNIGLRRAYKQGFDYSFILNSDMDFTDNEILMRMLAVFEKQKSVAVVSPEITAEDGYVYNPEIVRQSFFDMTIGMMSYRKKGRNIRKESKGYSEGYVCAYRPQGCCMLVNNKKMASVGFLDEHTFLYFEESILAERLLKKKYRVALLLDRTVIHRHEGITAEEKSDKKSFKSTVLYHIHYSKSFLYYLKEYRHFSVIKRAICLLFLNMKLLILKR